MSWRVRHFLKTVRAQHEYEREHDEEISATTNVTTTTTNIATNNNNVSSNTSTSTGATSNCIMSNPSKRVTIRTTPELEINQTLIRQAYNNETQLEIDATTTRNTNANSLGSPVVAAISAIASLGSITPAQNHVSPSAGVNATTAGRYINWCSRHTELATQPWCCIGDLIAFCDKYEYKTLSLTDTRTHNAIVAEVKALLTVGQAPFDLRKRFPGNIQNPENLWVCIGRCASVEYHLKKILSVFRKPLLQLSTDKQRAARQKFHLAVNELRLDISARISDVRLYDRSIFERDFQLRWQDAVE